MSSSSDKLGKWMYTILSTLNSFISLYKQHTTLPIYSSPILAVKI